MKRLVIILITIAVVFGGIIWFSSNKNASLSSNTNTASAQSEFDKVEQAVASGAKLYDVRTADEFATGHFANAVNWSLQDLQAGKLPDVSKDTKIYVYCRSGNRSGQSTTILKQAGYTNVTDLHGLTNVESLGGKLVTK
jgi:rhodanese-related sulfurtransferase